MNNYEVERANLLAENIRGFTDFVQRNYRDQNSYISNLDKLFRLKLLVEEYKFHIIADELLRVNKYSWDEKVTKILVDRFRNAINSISEFIDNNYDDLFIFSGRLHTLKSLCTSYDEVFSRR